MEGPPDEAYGRVTNPERYLPVHDAARRLVDELCADHRVSVARGLDADPELDDHGVTLLEVIHLVPDADDAAPITIALTDFPAVFVKAGPWRQGAYPHCGCDACDEPVDWVIDELRRDVDDVVSGRVVEEWDGTWMHFSRVGADGNESSGRGLREGATRDALGPPRRLDWKPWPRAT